MGIFTRINRALITRYRRCILRDKFLIAGQKWFSDKGDQTHRLNYQLNAESIVFDLGGFQGDFAAAINEKFGCKVYLFEPVHNSYLKCVKRFEGNSQVVCFNYGLSSKNGRFNIGLAENSSSFSSPHAQGEMEEVQLKSIVECINELDVKEIGLLKINIEGGEFEVLPAIIESGDINKVISIQIQFHNFVDNAETLRADIQARLKETHQQTWDYYFIWENWERKE